MRSYLSAWDPAWRWVLLLGLRQLRSDPVALGQLAADEANGSPGWAEESYAYGTLSQGITAAAVNEVALHCEDLFGLLKCLRDRESFARNIGSYKTGQVLAFGRRLASSDDETIGRMFLVPDSETVEAGLEAAIDSAQDIAAVEAGRERLCELVRETATHYTEHEDLHNCYKHGLRLRMQAFGQLSGEEIARRQSSVKTGLWKYTTAPLAATIRPGIESPPLMFTAGEAQTRHLVELIDQRNLLRVELAHEVDLDELVERSHTVMQLLQIAQANRLGLGQIEDGLQTFELPGTARWERSAVRLQLDRALTLEDFD